MALIPFFWPVTYQAAANYVVNGLRVLSKIVPAVTDVFKLQPAHFQ